MSDWKPDAHRDPHHWLATLGGHASIGFSLWLACMWGNPWAAVLAASLIYAAFEAWQADRYGLLLWDAILDWVGVTFGALTGAALWTQGWALAAISVASCLIVGYAGYRKRQP